MAVKIVIKGPAELHDDEFEPITDQAKLTLVDGLVGGEGETMSDYLEGGEHLATIGLQGGDLRLAQDSRGGLEVITTYVAARELSELELAALVEFTEGQWSDGMGTHGFYESLDALEVEGLNVSCKPLGSKGMTTAEQEAV